MSSLSRLSILFTFTSFIILHIKMDISISVSGILLAFITLCLASWWAKWFSKKRYPPGPWGFPIFGHLPLLSNKPELKYSKWRQKYGDIFSIRFGSWNTIIVNGYEAIKDAAERKDDVFSGRPEFATEIAIRESFDGLESITFCNFTPKYLQLRKRTTMAMRKYVNKCDYSPNDLFREEAEKLTEKLLRYPPDEPVSIDLDIQLAVISALYQMLFGRGKEDEIKPHLNLIIESTETFNKFVSSGNLVDVIPWLRYIMKMEVDKFKAAITATDSITKSKISEHRTSFQTGQTRDILDALCDLSNDLPENGTGDTLSATLLQFQILSLQGAGFDTTSRTIMFIILYLITFPDVQERAQKEIDQELGSSRNISGNDQAKLPYVMATVLEVLRKTAIVPFAIPHLTLHDTKLRGYDIDKDTVVFFNLHSVAHEESYWGDPENFRPERLLDDSGNLDRVKCSHIMAFGAGRRQCPGETIAKMKIFIVIATLLQRCSFQKAGGSDLNLDPTRGLVLSPKPFKVIVKRRL
ncbi:cytochrome P450 1A1-like [Ruditapes philippinarum]|uniref:cytochrome P450 1A1-like n=1 Tax=Ruditapes philippinarum TaxID=129788 RepID=UPI00295AC96E|nr:cytochrome P450 1A1-like [Ruditapes philippinarum]